MTAPTYFDTLFEPQPTMKVLPMRRLPGQFMPSVCMAHVQFGVVQKCDAEPSYVGRLESDLPTMDDFVAAARTVAATVPLALARANAIAAVRRAEVAEREASKPRGIELWLPWLR